LADADNDDDDNNNVNVYVSSNNTTEIVNTCQFRLLVMIIQVHMTVCWHTVTEWADTHKNQNVGARPHANKYCCFPCEEK
jgi:hypothetical protein